MSEWIDHAAIADSRLAAALPWLSSAGRSDLGQVANILAAQGHATLALVEQQRIANLIALGRMTDNSEWIPVAEARHALVEVRPYVYQALDGTKGEDEYEVLRPDIAAALGIGDPR